MPIRILHPSTGKLGSSGKRKIPRSEDSCIKNRLQVCLPLGHPSFCDGTPNSHPASVRRACNPDPSSHIGQHTLPFQMGSYFGNNLWLSKWIVEMQRLGANKLTCIGPAQNPQTHLSRRGHTCCGREGIDHWHTSWPLRLCENILCKYLYDGDLVFVILKVIYGFKFPKRFLEISSRDLTSSLLFY